MDKLQLTGQNLGQVFNPKSSHWHAAYLWCYQIKLPNLKFKTWPMQLLGSLMLDIALPDQAHYLITNNCTQIAKIKVLFCKIRGLCNENLNNPL
jgi:hypothetical protein